MKKKFAIMLVAIMTVFLAAGCAPGDDDAAQQTDPANTQTTEASSSDQEKTLIGEAKAKEIALKKVKGAKEADITKLRLEKEDGRQQYDGEMVYSDKKYEFEIDAVTGEILSWEEDEVKK